MDLALAGLQLGGGCKRQGSPTSVTKQTENQTLTPTRSRPGFPPKSAALPRAIRRFAKFVTTHPQQRTAFQDTFTSNMQQLQHHPSYPASGQEFMLNSADMLNQSYTGCFPNPADMRSNFSESDMSNVAIWGAGNQTSDEWNVQQQLQNLMNPNHSYTAAQTGVGRNLSADFTRNPQLAKYMMNNAISEFLMNSSDSWSSKIEVPQQGGSGRGDSFSSKIEYPINCDSFTSKLSAASIRDDSFSSQRLVDPLLFNSRPMEPLLDPTNDAGYNLPELSMQELESLAEGDLPKEASETALNSPQLEANIRSEKNLLLAISGILKCALVGTYSDSDLLSDLNFLVVSVRRHFLDYQNFSSNAAETFLLIASTLPVVCLAAKFNEDVMASLKKFMMMISTGHPSLNNAACLMELQTPAAATMELQSPAQSNEAYQRLSKIHHKLSVELNAVNSQSMTSQDFSSSQLGTTDGGVGNPVLKTVENPSDSITSEAAERAN